ncbi:alpha-ketoglutarate-dependent dioxygenase AlkB [Litoribacter ruber]|uniref:alpha-ketoglutarate-dependent dioxygenase AlkB family protein n=1 Tax=Litoribacter ruber TaxID=702568 RepID=UPI001BDA6472|nr:alpha-ketoglutarate-dependent dioxygenase AlkB [Litoribacter ruber]MBT0812567.1 alpha-ketoglutarate-dependent dioxygenase AlkB [Litoribacter ruber]
MSKNLLPSFGEVYYPSIFTPEESKRYFSLLREHVKWEHRAIQLFGKKVMQPRLTALYGNSDVPYKYSGLELQPLPMTKELFEIQERIGSQVQSSFTHVLLNYYRDGNDSMGWHRDNEKSLGVDPAIASVSFGAARKFLLRRYENKQEKVQVLLEDGSLVLMKGSTQTYWEHSLPKSTRIAEGRINLTFRSLTA